MTQPTTATGKRRDSGEIYAAVLAAAVAAGIDRAHAIACAAGAAKHNWSTVRRALISANAMHADIPLRDAYHGRT